MLSNILDKIAFWSIFIIVVLLPVFFIPFTKIPAEVSKTGLAVVGMAVAIISWAAARFSDGKILIPKSKIITAGFVVVLTTLISAVFSDNQALSLFGIMFDTGTFWFILTAFFLMFFTSLLVRTEKQSRFFLFGTIASFLAVFIFQTLRYFMPETLSLGIFSGKIANLLGSWNSFGYIAGLSTVISVFAIEFISTTKRTRIFLYIAILFSLFTIITVNSAVLWEMVGIFSLFIFILKLANTTHGVNTTNNKTFPVHVFLLVVISLLFFLSGKFIGNLLPNTLGLSNIEISPSISTTFSVGKKSLMQDPIFGVGPNRFGYMWALWKPAIVNNTQFWDTSFTSGFGFLQTVAINTGILGIISWLFFIGLIVWFGIRSLLINLQFRNNSLQVLYFTASLFMLVASFIYSFGIVGIMLMFVFVGLFIAESVMSREKGSYEFKFLNDPRKSFISILLLVFVMLGTTGVSVKFIERFVSVSYFNKALTAINAKAAQDNIAKAVDLHKSDLYFRTMAQIELANLSILSQKQGLNEQEKSELQTSFDKALLAAGSAISFDNKNYINHQMLGIVYSTVGRLGVDGAGEKAITAYSEASKLNPLNPGIKLSIANEYALMDKDSEAQKYATEALSLAPNYVDALVLLAQIERNLGNTAKATEYAERARSLDPNNKTLGNYAEGLKVVPDSKNEEEASKEETKQ